MVAFIKDCPKGGPVSFLFPVRLYLLLLNIPVAVLLVISSVMGWKNIKKLQNSKRINETVSSYMIREFVLNILIVLCFSSLIISFSEPYWGMRPEVELTGNTDAVLAIDVSKSMLAKDVEKSRLDAAKEIALSLINSMPEVRWGLVAFKGRGSIIYPVSQDRIGIEQAIKNLSPSLFRSSGTNIANGLTAALDNFPLQSDRKKIIILFSDGEALSGDYSMSLVRALGMGVTIYSVGLGTEDGSVIENADGTLVKNRAGEVVITRFDPSVLMHISNASGGKFIKLNSEKDISSIVMRIASENDVSDKNIRLVPAKRYYIFSMMSLVFMMLYIFVRGREWQKK